MKKRYLIITVIIAVMLITATLLSACGDPKTPQSGTYALTVWCAEADRDMIEGMLYDYEQLNKNNVYKWTVQNVGEDVAGTRVIGDPTTAADVFSFASDQLGKLVVNNAILAVPNQYHSMIDEQIYVAQQAATYDGRYYAYPYTYENCFMYYNKSMLTATAVASLETLLSASVTAETILAMDMTDSYYTTIFLYTAGVDIFGENGTDPTSIDLANENALAACRYIKALKDQKKFSSVDESDQSTALRNGRVAAVISGPHMIKEFDTALMSNFAVAKLPTININGRDTQMVSFSGVKLYGVNRQSQHTEEAAKLAAFLANADNQYIRLNDREFCPTDEALYEEIADNAEIETVKVVIDQSEYTKLKPSLTQMESYWNPMASFLNGVYSQTMAEDVWTAQLQSIELGLREE